ncbi:MAG: hypothetical protein M3O30_09875 [Planctomycetota bacterium]|nr:hypothetical protein [Planctomycetota bacterium]
MAYKAAQEIRQANDNLGRATKIAATRANNPSRTTGMVLEEPSPGSGFAIGVALFGGVLLMALLVSGLSQMAAIIFLLALLGMLALLKPQVAIVATFVFLAVMGDLRRLLIQDVSASFDPMLLVGPITAILLTSVAYLNGLLNLKSKTSKLIFALMMIMLLEVFNPIQGGLAVGLAGGLFYLIPILWYWIGKAWGTESLLDQMLFQTLAIIGLAAAILGIQQAMYGFLPFEQQAMERTYKIPIMISGTQFRPMGFFPSSSEFTQYLGIAIVLPIASLFAGRFRVGLLLVPILAIALVTSGVRGPLVGSLGTIIIIWALIGRSPAVRVFRFVIAGTLVAIGLVWALNQIQFMDLSPQVSTLLQHQSEGIIEMKDERKSTATGHMQMLLMGLWGGVTNPLGRGLGSTTMAAQKFGGSLGCTEIDFSDAFLSMGIIGGIVYLRIISEVFKSAFMRWRLTKSSTSLALIAILFVAFGRWLYGGQYSTTALCWFCIGALDRVGDRSAQLTRIASEPRRVSLLSYGSNRQIC